jgi:4-amino-4-deoxy-L-arabinose transferase-like glycosyltransferase
MAPTAPPESPTPGRSFALGLVGIALVTLWRVVLLPFDSADLFVDDAQYWFWGQTLDWGYYSKPPLIAWILRLSTALGGDAPVFIRLPLPLIHAATAVVLALIARRLFGPRAGGIAGFAFASLPAVALGSLLVSTDTPMLLCFALAMLAQLHLAERRSLPWALLLGAAVGLGLMAKYAMIYFPVSAVLAALLLPSARIAWRDALVAALLALAVIAPNLAWNAANQFATVQHTAYNADWRGPPIDIAGLAGFLAGQFAVAGPVFFAAYLAGLRYLASPERRYLALMSLPVLAIVSVQALISGANANWAAAGHLAALVLATAVLLPRPRLLALGLAINLAITAALPVAAVFADRWRIGDNLALHRYVGQGDLSRHAAEVARANGFDTLVSGNRAMLADFFYTLRDAGLAIYAEPTEGFPPHHYAQKHPLPPGEGDVLYITGHAGGPACRAPGTPVEEVARWRPALGFNTNDIFAFRVPRGCWFPDA